MRTRLSRSAIAICAGLCLASACVVPTARAHPVSVGHRGGSVLGPESTLATYEISIAGGTDWLELDVWLSADGVPVIFHDETLYRTSNGLGYVYEKTLAQLEALDVGSWFSPAFTGERIPRLDEALGLIQGRARILLDIKRPEYIAPIATVIRNSGFPLDDVYAWIRITESMAPSFRQHLPEAHVLFGPFDKLGDMQEQRIWERAQEGDHGLIANHVRVNQAFVDLAHSYGLTVFVFTLLSPAFSPMLALGVDGLVASDPTSLASMLPLADPECSDGIDDDADGFVDFPQDPGCWGPEDQAESAACSDGLDNDLDGYTDFPQDPGCFSSFYDWEATACSNGIDDNGDGLADFPSDPGCFSSFDQHEGLTCSDGLDNDADGFVDFPTDPGCLSREDASENAPDLRCDDGIDNDLDGRMDFPEDPGCSSPASAPENPPCNDGIDNDFDGQIDLADPNCTHAWSSQEGTSACGLGSELALVLAPLAAFDRRRRRPRT